MIALSVKQMCPLTSKILRFWFGFAETSAKIEKKPEWFRSTEAHDSIIKSRFSDVQIEASLGELDYLKDYPEGCLALILLLDQFPRHIFRNSPKAFETDTKAREVALSAIKSNYHTYYGDWQRIFCYLPFEHSECIEDHNFIIPFFSKLNKDKFYNTQKTAIDHMKVIQRFGRYPHRNAILCRKNTQEEEKYLMNPPYWGMTKTQVQTTKEKIRKIPKKLSKTNK